MSVLFCFFVCEKCHMEGIKRVIYITHYLKRICHRLPRETMVYFITSHLIVIVTFVEGRQRSLSFVMKCGLLLVITITITPLEN